MQAINALHGQLGDLGLSVMALDVLRQRSASGAVFAFRGRKGGQLALLYWDGQGLLPLLQGSRARALSMAEH